MWINLIKHRFLPMGHLKLLVCKTAQYMILRQPLKWDTTSFLSFYTLFPASLEGGFNLIEN